MRIWVTGHNGMLGSAVVRQLDKYKHDLLLTERSEVDLMNTREVQNFFEREAPDYVFHIAAKVGGIGSNALLPAEFLYENTTIQNNVLHFAKENRAKKLIFVASNCTYPKNADNPISENQLFSGPLEENVHAYAVSKLAGIEMCNSYRKQYGCDFVSVIPPNLYGLGDNFNPDKSHIVAALMSKAHQAKCNGSDRFVVWGDGTARRELLNVDDLAEAMVDLMWSKTEYNVYNIGSGQDHSVAQIARLIADTVGFEGDLEFDAAKPNGTMRKLLDSSRIFQTGWAPKINLQTGLKKMYEHFLNNQ